VEPLTVLENVMEAPILVQKREKGGSPDEAMEMLKKVGIADQGRRLSGATFGRPAAARRHRPRALHQSARYAVRRADLGARPELEVEVLRVIKLLADEGRTMILVTHDMDFRPDGGRPRDLPSRRQDRGGGRGGRRLRRHQSARLRQFLSAGNHA